MSLFKVFDIAGSALSAQSIRLNVVSSNLANADVAASTAEAAYKARHPVFATIYEEAQGADQSAGVMVSRIVESEAPARSEYAPQHPLADDNGYIYLPNVNSIEEMTNMISASRSYQGNVEVFNTSKQLLLGILRLGE